MPILCKIQEGLTKDVCSMLIGGLKTIYLANIEDIISITDSDSDNILDTITMGTSGSFYKFDIAKNTSSFTQALQVNGANKYILPSLDFTVARNDQTAFDVSESLALGTFVAIAENRMGRKIILGQLNGLEATVLEVNSGVAEGDSAGIHITLTGSELELGKVFDGEIPL